MTNSNLGHHHYYLLNSDVFIRICNPNQVKALGIRLFDFPKIELLVFGIVLWAFLHQF
jgi:hypothetical protein